MGGSLHIKQVPANGTFGEPKLQMNHVHIQEAHACSLRSIDKARVDR